MTASTDTSTGTTTDSPTESVPPTIQIAVDCAEPHRLVRFWAAALSMEVEDHHDQVEAMVAAGHATYDDTVLVNGRRAWPDAACHDPTGALPRLLFQRVPEPKQVKNRWHLDLQVGAERRDAEVARLVDLGATQLWEGQQGPHSWVTLADPEGNELCVA